MRVIGLAVEDRQPLTPNRSNEALAMRAIFAERRNEI
jgi:hypothetical protein